MKLLTKDLSALKRADLTYAQVGILLTRMFHDKLGNDKAIFSLMQNNNVMDPKDLITLHEKKLIKWSGYARAKKKLDPKLDKVYAVAKGAEAFMNKMYGRKFSTSQKKIEALLNSKQKYSEEDIKLVISNRWKVWAEDSYMAQFLHPETIFRPSKFAKYLEEANLTGVGKNVVESELFDSGDMLSKSDIKRLGDKEMYVVKIKDGYSPKFGEETKMEGKSLKWSITKSANLEKSVKAFVDDGTEMAPDSRAVQVFKFIKAL